MHAWIGRMVEWIQGFGVFLCGCRVLVSIAKIDTLYDFDDPRQCITLATIERC